MSKPSSFNAPRCPSCGHSGALITKEAGDNDWVVIHRLCGLRTNLEATIKNFLTAHLGHSNWKLNGDLRSPTLTLAENFGESSAAQAFNDLRQYLGSFIEGFHIRHEASPSKLSCPVCNSQSLKATNYYVYCQDPATQKTHYQVNLREYLKRFFTDANYNITETNAGYHVSIWENRYHGFTFLFGSKTELITIADLIYRVADDGRCILLISKHDNPDPESYRTLIKTIKEGLGSTFSIIVKAE